MAGITTEAAEAVYIAWFNGTSEQLLCELRLAGMLELATAGLAPAMARRKTRWVTDRRTSTPACEEGIGDGFAVGEIVNNESFHQADFRAPKRCETYWTWNSTTHAVPCRAMPDPV